MDGGEVIVGEEETALWEKLREFNWLPVSHTLLKVPVTPARIPALEARLEQGRARRHYSVGGNLAWVGWPGEAGEIDAILRELDLSGLRVLGLPAPPWVGVRLPGRAFARRVKRALDSEGRFLEL